MIHIDLRVNRVAWFARPPTEREVALLRPGSLLAQRLALGDAIEELKRAIKEVINGQRPL